MASMNIASLQTPHGYPEFVNLEAKFTCLICGRVLKDAMQTTCGHRICEACVPPIFEGKTEPVDCPAAEVDCDPQYQKDIGPDRGVRREIRVLKVYCTYKSDGCIVVLPWKDLESHLTECEFRPVECPNKKFGCAQTIPLSKQDEHLALHCMFRLIRCKYCDENIMFLKQEEHENLECTKVPLICKFGCDLNFSSRPEMNQHLESCPRRPLECSYKVIGCNFKGTEGQINEHLVSDVNKHLELLTVQTANMDYNNAALRGQVQKVTSERNELRQQLERATAEVNIVKTEAVTLKALLEKLNKDNKELKLKMVSMTERIIHLERKSEDMAKKEVVDKHDQDLRAMQSSLTQARNSISNIERQGVNRGASGGGAADPELARRLDSHDTQLAQVDVQMAELDLRFQIMETASYNGHLLWKLRDYNRRKTDAVSGKTLSLYSQPFYTHRFGYKMCARIYLNGDGMGKGSHLSLFFVLMRGEYDNLLPWPFQQKVTMILLDQESGQVHLSDTFRPDPSSTSFRKPTTEMNIASGCPLFVSHSVLETPKYIKDDTIFIKFIVDTTNLSHP